MLPKQEPDVIKGEATCDEDEEEDVLEDWQNHQEEDHLQYDDKAVKMEEDYDYSLAEEAAQPSDPLSGEAAKEEHGLAGHLPEEEGSGEFHALLQVDAIKAEVADYSAPLASVKEELPDDGHDTQQAMKLILEEGAEEALVDSSGMVEAKVELQVKAEDEHADAEGENDDDNADMDMEMDMDLEDEIADLLEEAKREVDEEAGLSEVKEEMLLCKEQDDSGSETDDCKEMKVKAESDEEAEAATSFAPPRTASSASAPSRRNPFEQRGRWQPRQPHESSFLHQSDTVIVIQAGPMKGFRGVIHKIFGGYKSVICEVTLDATGQRARFSRDDLQLESRNHRQVEANERQREAWREEARARAIKEEQARREAARTGSSQASIQAKQNKVSEKEKAPARPEPVKRERERSASSRKEEMCSWGLSLDQAFQDLASSKVKKEAPQESPAEGSRAGSGRGQGQQRSANARPRKAAKTAPGSELLAKWRRQSERNRNTGRSML
mmetsp:Transcript_11235/g.25773  ORF Transcript_11235/g.25773 Transcript_11235/m.25773 type:complete len:496 (+) Transcript_11235:48-1535(+)